MKDMKLSAEQAKAEYGECAPCGLDDGDDAGPKYPWGLRIDLDQDSLTKLGFGLMPVGTEVTVMAKATVIGTSSRERIKGKPSQDMELQITSLDLTPVQADRMANSAKRMFPDAD